MRRGSKTCPAQANNSINLCSTSLRLCLVSGTTDRSQIWLSFATRSPFVEKRADPDQTIVGRSENPRNLLLTTFSEVAPRNRRWRLLVCSFWLLRIVNRPRLVRSATLIVPHDHGGIPIETLRYRLRTLRVAPLMIVHPKALSDYGAQEKARG